MSELEKLDAALRLIDASLEALNFSTTKINEIDIDRLLEYGFIEKAQWAKIKRLQERLLVACGITKNL
jgi:hypothetical protein